MKSLITHVYETLKYSVVGDLAKAIRLNRFRRAWRRANQHNQTIPNNVFESGLVSVGAATYGELNIVSFGESDCIKIGSYCSIAGNVHFIINAGHRTDTFSTYPYIVKMLRAQKSEAVSSGDIVVEDDVWIGHGVTILSGITIGQGAIIGAGAVVTKSVPAYSIVVGVPARVIKYRFEPETIRLLKSVDFTSIDESFVQDNIPLLYKPLDSSLAATLKEKLEDVEH